MRSLLTSSANADRFSAAEDWLHVAVEQLGEVLVIAPTHRAADDFVRLACPDQAGLLGIYRTTLLHFAGDLAAKPLAQKKIARLSGLGAEALAARAIHVVKEQTDLEYFAPIDKTPGFPRAVAQTILELRQAFATPHAIAEYIAATEGAGERVGGLRDLQRLLTAYEEELFAQRLADRTRVIQVAAEFTAREEVAHRALGLPILFLDVAPKTSIEADFISTLVARSPQVLATVLRRDLAGIEKMASILGVPAAHLDDRVERPDAEATLSSLDRARRFVFSVDALQKRPADESLTFFSAPGEARECVEIARRVLWLAGEEGCAFDRVAVLLRSPETYQPLLQDALRRADIPGYFTRGAKRPDPSGRALLALLACASERLSASRFAEYLSLGQVPPLDESGAPSERKMPWVPPASDIQMVFASLEPEEPITPSSLPKAAEETQVRLQVPKNWEELLVDAAVIGGGARWQRRLSGLEQELRLHLQNIDPQDELHHMKTEELKSLKNLQNFALPVIEFLDRLPRAARWARWNEVLTELSVMCLENPDPVLAVLAELQPMGDVGPVGLEEVREVLTPRLSFIRDEAEGSRFGKVFVGTVEEAAGRRFDVVFLPGLAEGIFPRRAFEDPLLLDDHRRVLSEDLPLRSKRFEDERILLSRALGTAEQRLVVSYPRMDVTRGRPRVPSFYALDVLRAAEGQLPDLLALEKRAAAASDARLGWPAPHAPEHAIDEAEYDLAVLGPLIFDAPLAVRGHGRYLIEGQNGNPHLVRSLRAHAARWRASWSSSCGLIDPSEAAKEVLAKHRLTARSYSPTALQNYAPCPYRFFLYAIHRLRPKEHIAALEEMDPLTRGSLFHNVQFHFYGAMKEAGLHPLTKARQEPALALLDAVTERVVAHAEELLAPAIPEVWHREVETMRADLRRWVRHVADQDGEWQPTHAEFAFGLSMHDEGRDPASVAEPIRVLDKYAIRGSIDLIEQHGAMKVIRVTDHKSGRSPRDKPSAVGGGEHLQPLLYALVAEQAFEAEIESGRLYYCSQRGGYDEVSVPLNDQTRAKIQTVLETIDDAVKEGFFPAAPRRNVCQYCNYRVVCGPREGLRASKKRQDRMSDLIQLRKLP